MSQLREASHMKLKSYFSASVEEAMTLARKELGEEALLIHARPSTPETRYLGAYEVVFGVGGVESAVPAAAPPPRPGPSPEPDRWSAELADVRRQLDRLTRGFDLPAADAKPDLQASRLGAEEIDETLISQLLQGSRLGNLFTVDARLGRPGSPRAVVALVGPPGAGKTSALVKIAAHYGMAARQPVQILSADVERVGAADQLRTLASILGVGCEIAETPAALGQLLEEHRSRKLVLIDTPGFSCRELEDAAELASVLTGPEIDTHLVLPASLKPADMRRTGDRFEIFQPSKLLFTKLDETCHFGALPSESAYRKRPISFLSTGQQIPDDFEPATVARLEALVMGDIPPFNAQQSMGAAA